MKKLGAILACGAMALTLAATPIHAANDINDAEQRILDYIEAGTQINGETFDTSVYYDDVKAILSAETVDLTRAEAEVIMNAAKDTKAFIEEHADDMVSIELVTQLIEKASPAAKVLDITISYDATKEEIILKDANGKIIQSIKFPLGDTPTFEEEPTDKLENTGENFTSTYVIIGGLMVLLVGAGYFATKRKGNC